MATDGFDICPDQNIRSFFTDSLTGQITEQSKIDGRVKLKKSSVKSKKIRGNGKKSSAIMLTRECVKNTWMSFHKAFMFLR